MRAIFIISEAKIIHGVLSRSYFLLLPDFMCVISNASANINKHTDNGEISRANMIEKEIAGWGRTKGK